MTNCSSTSLLLLHEAQLKQKSSTFLMGEFLIEDRLNQITEFLSHEPHSNVEHSNWLFWL